LDPYSPAIISYLHPFSPKVSRLLSLRVLTERDIDEVEKRIRGFVLGSDEKVMALASDLRNIMDSSRSAQERRTMRHDGRGRRAQHDAHRKVLQPLSAIPAQTPHRAPSLAHDNPRLTVSTWTS